MQSLSNINEGAARALAGGAICLTKATLAADATGGQEDGITTGGTVTYFIDGVHKTKTAIDNGQYTAGHDTLLDGYTCFFAFTLNAAGTLTTYQGRVFKSEVVSGVTKYRGYKTLKDTSGTVTGYQQELALADYNCVFVPAVPSGYALLGVAKIAASGANFVPSTTAHGTNNTATFTDLIAFPAATDL